MGNIIKYYLPLEEFDISDNDFDKVDVQHLKKTAILSKRFKSNMYKI